MSTRHLGLIDVGEAFDNNTPYTAAQITRNHRLMDSLMVGALRAMSPGVLFSEYGATAFEVSAGAGLSVNIAAGSGVIKHTTMGAAYVLWETTYNLTGLTASQPNYIFATIENTVTNKTQESMVPKFTAQVSSVAPDGAILLGIATCGVASVTGVVDHRRMIRPLNFISGVYSAARTYYPNDVLKDSGKWWVNIAESTAVAPAEGASWTQFSLLAHTHTASEITDFDAAARNAVENLWGEPVADLAALRAVAAADRQDKQQRFVEGVGTHGATYGFDATGTGTDDGDFIIAPDVGTGRWFLLNKSGAGGVTDHGGLTGLGDDDHAIYLLLAGRTTGQTVNGGVNSGASLTLHSTAHGTKGFINFGANSAYDETNKRLGIGTQAPAFDIEIVSSADAIAAATAFGGMSGRFLARSAGGTSGAPTQTLDGNVLGLFGARGYGATGWGNSSAGRWKVVAAGDFTDASQPGEIQFETIPVGSVTPAAAGRISSSQQLVWGATSGDAAALVQFDSTTRGFLMMRMTTTQRDDIASPPNGLLIYNTTTNSLNERRSGTWVDLNDAANLTGTLANARLTAAQRTRTINLILGDGTGVITTGNKGDIHFDFDCVIQQVTLLADQSGSIVIDLWKDTYTNHPPTDADSITASAPATISGATKSQDSTLTGWTTSIAAGQSLRVNVDSATTVTRVTLAIKVQV